MEVTFQPQALKHCLPVRMEGSQFYLTNSSEVKGNKTCSTKTAFEQTCCKIGFSVTQYSLPQYLRSKTLWSGDRTSFEVKIETSIQVISTLSCTLDTKELLNYIQSLLFFLCTYPYYKFVPYVTNIAVTSAHFLSSFPWQVSANSSCLLSLCVVFTCTNAAVTLCVYREHI